MSVAVYTMEGCPFCEKAKSFLREKGIAFEEVPAPFGSHAWEEMSHKTGGGSLPQILIDDVAVGGYAELVALAATGKLFEMVGLANKEGETPLYDVIIIGAGPAGLSAAIYAVRKLMKTLLVGRELGGQVGWSADLENYLGFSHINAADLVARFKEHVRNFGIESLLGVDVTQVDLTGRIKRVGIEDGRWFHAKTLILATGGRHRSLDIPGEHQLVGRGVSYCSTCDAPLYGDANVAVVGGGNSALEAVLDLMNIARHIYLVSLTPLTGDPVYQSRVQNSPKVTILTEHVAMRVVGDREVSGLDVRSLKTGESGPLQVEGVFVEIGMMPNSSLFLDTLATNKRGEILVDSECRTGIAGVFACGDVTNVPFKQVVVAVGEGAKAALSAYGYLLNQK